MTLPRLLNTESLIIHISGENKQNVLDKALAGSNVEELPIRSVLQQTQVPVTVYWAS
jgi:6-phosphogluconolactonase